MVDTPRNWQPGCQLQILTTSTKWDRISITLTNSIDACCPHNISKGLEIWKNPSRHASEGRTQCCLAPSRKIENRSWSNRNLRVETLYQSDGIGEIIPNPGELKWSYQFVPSGGPSRSHCIQSDSTCAIHHTRDTEIPPNKILNSSPPATLPSAQDLGGNNPQRLGSDETNDIAMDAVRHMKIYNLRSHFNLIK